jgi:hypothetical protein
MFSYFPQAALGENHKNSGYGPDGEQHGEARPEGRQRELRRGKTEGKRGSIMGDEIHITRIVERFSSNTLSRSRPAGHCTSAATRAQRDELIGAAAEVIAEGGDPRLDRSRALP